MQGTRFPLRAAGLMAAVSLASVATSAPVLAADDSDKVLYVYNWTEYMPDEVIEHFEEQTGIDVVYSTFDSNEAMYAKLKLLNSDNSYDLVFPSTYYIDKMAREGLLQKLDVSKLDHFEDLDPNLVDRDFDKGNQYSVPYMWGSAGIGYNPDYVEEGALISWNDLWNDKYRDKLLLSNDMREVFHVALASLGFSGNTTDPDEIKAAYEKLTQLMPNVRAFNSDAARVPFMQGEVDAGLIWNGEVYQANQEGVPVEYVYPEEGIILWMDTMAIPSNARHVDAAYQFIDYLISPEVSKEISEYVGYTTPSLAAKNMMAPEVRDNPVVFPTQLDLARGEFQTDVGDALSIYQKYWEQLKTGH